MAELQWTAMTVPPVEGHEPSLTFRLARTTGGRLSMDLQGNLRVSLAALMTRATQWNPRDLQVHGTAKRDDQTEVKLPWELAGGEPDRATFYPPEEQLQPEALIVTFSRLITEGEVDVTLELTLEAKDGTYTIDAPVRRAAEPPIVRTFSASPSLLVLGSSTTLEWACERFEQYRIEGGGQELVSERADTPKSKKLLTVNQAGLRDYTLTATRGAAVTTKSIRLNVSSSAGWKSSGSWWDAPGQQVGGLIVGGDGHALLALVRGSGGASLWSSPDGFTAWERVSKSVPRHVATSPAVFFNGTVVVVGGSKVDPHHVSNDVYRLDPATGAWARERGPWAARMGHACVVFRDRDGDAKIWVIGGADGNWNALKDVWVSGDAKTWTKKTGEVPWSARCMLAASASADELWIGGGFPEPDGAALGDIWKKPAGEDAWRQVTIRDIDNRPVEIVDPNARLHAFTLTCSRTRTYVVAYQDHQQDRSVFAAIKEDRTDSYSMQRQASRPAWPNFRREPSRLESVLFNGCLWLFAHGYLGRDEVEASSLSYWVPPPESIIV
jgi:galactose oxidase-like protein